MSATGADHQSERAVPREGRTWRLVRKAFLIGKSIGSLGYLIAVGMIACWIIAIFFGASLFLLMPRSAKLVTGYGTGGGDRFDASSEQMPWLFQSTNRLYRLAGRQPFESGRPIGGAGLLNDGAAIGSENDNPAEVDQKSIRAEPTNARMVHEPQNQALSDPAASGEPWSAPPPEHRAPAATGFPTSMQALQSEASRTKRSQKVVANKTPPAHPPLQAIQDVLQKHAGLLK